MRLTREKAGTLSEFPAFPPVQPSTAGGYHNTALLVSVVSNPVQLVQQAQEYHDDGHGPVHWFPRYFRTGFSFRGRPPRFPFSREAAAFASDVTEAMQAGHCRIVPWVGHFGFFTVFLSCVRPVRSQKLAGLFRSVSTLQALQRTAS